jgi:UDP-GlcNAc3NAcA epimerase
LDLKPDWLLVFGDTNSTLAGALAAAKLHIPVAHVEAGLRSFNRRMPEEINRILTDQVSDLLFAPTQAAVSHLQREGVAASRIHHVGDVMYDAALHYAAVAQSKSTILQQLGLAPKRYVLATVHRAENTEEPRRLAALLAGLGRVAAEVPVVLPLHPRTRAALRREGFPAAALSMLRIVEPVGYLDMIQLERNARLIATDSGGVQKEAFFHGVPCATLRSETEWTELVESGWNRLVRAEDAEGIAQEILAALDTRGAPLAAYGDGRAAQRIAARIAGETPPASTALNPSPNFTDRRAA